MSKPKVSGKTKILPLVPQASEEEIARHRHWQEMSDLWKLAQSPYVDFSKISVGKTLELIEWFLRLDIKRSEPRSVGLYTWEEAEEAIYNETRLYKALGKDDARSVLGNWESLKGIAQFLYRRKKGLFP